MVAGLLAVPLVLLLGWRDGEAAELLENGDFEQWNAEGPQGWFGEATATPGESGLGALLDADSTAVLQQSVAVTPGTRYAASVRAKSVSGTPAVVVRLTFFEDDRDPAGTFESPTVLATSAFKTSRVEAVAPVGSSFAVFGIVATSSSGAGSVTFDSASLSLVAASTPTATPIATQPTPSATATASITVAPSPTRTPATKTSTPPKSATPTPGVSTPSPTPPGEGEEFDGGLLRNGGFEQVRDAQPVSWAKFGGEMRANDDAKAGNWSVALNSNTSTTKWIHQVVPVSGGDWYEGRVDARVSYGQGEVFLRISWYIAVDGSGSSIAQHDSAVSTSSSWEVLSTGPIQAPGRARAARVRLMLRPEGAAGAGFDNAWFGASEEPLSPAELPSVRLPFLARDSESGVAGERRLTMTLLSPDGSDLGARTQAQQATPGVRISEIASDPAEAGRDTDYEWVELANTGTAPVDLAGWQLGEAKQLDARPAYVLAPGAYVVVAAKSTVLGPDVPAIRVPDGDIGRGLNNSGDVVRLVAPDGSEADAVSYGDDASVTSPAPTAPGTGQTVGWDPDRGIWRRTQQPTPGGANVFAQAPTGSSPTPARAQGSAPSAAEGAAGEEPHAAIDVAEGGDGDSPVPWILLGAAGGAGAVAGALGGARAWASRRR
jgi:hypothetical protein